METDNFSPADIVDFIFNTYNKHSMCVIKQFRSFEDKVILVQSNIPDCHSEKFILKIFLVKRDNLSLEIRASLVNYLYDRGIKCSNFLKGKNGRFAQCFKTASLSNYLCVLYTYLPGIELENAADLRDSKTLFELGAYLGYLHTVFDGYEIQKEFRKYEKFLSQRIDLLQNFSAENLNPDSSDPWLLSNFHLLGTEKHLSNIQSSYLKVKVERVIRNAVEVFQSSLHLLKKGLIHGDFHTLNIIIDEHFPKTEHLLGGTHFPDDCSVILGSHQIELMLKGSNDIAINCLEKENVLAKYGLIDFGEIVYSFRILEVGRLIADLMVTILMTHYFNQHLSQQFSDFEQSLDSIKEKQSFPLVHEKNQHSDGKPLNDAARIFSEIHNEMCQDVNKCLKHLFCIGRIILQGYCVSNSLSKHELAVLKHTILISLVQYIILSNNSDETTEYILMCRQAAVIIFLELCDNVRDEVFMSWADTAKN